MRTALTTAGLALALVVIGSMPPVSTTTAIVPVCDAATVEEQQVGYCEFRPFYTCIDDSGEWQFHFEGFVGPPEP